jgi:hypothetical protein
MIRIKDKIALIVLAAVVSTLFLNILDWIAVWTGIINWHIWQIAASVYFPISDVDGIAMLITGALTHTSLVALAAVIICYTLYFTGRDYYILKGIGVYMVFFVVVYGAVLRLGIARISPTDAETVVAHLIGHLAEGIFIPSFIIGWADDVVWRSKNAS